MGGTISPPAAVGQYPPLPRPTSARSSVRRVLTRASPTTVTARRRGAGAGGGGGGGGDSAAQERRLKSSVVHETHATKDSKLHHVSKVYFYSVSELLQEG